MVGVLDGKTVGKYVSLVGSSGFDPAAWKGMFAKPQPVKKFIEILTGLKSAKVKSNSDMSLVAIDDYGKVEQGLAALKKQIKSAKGDANFQAVLKSFDKLVEKGTKDLEKRKKPLVAKFHETQKTLEDFQKRENSTNYLKNVTNFSNACMKHRDNIEVIKSHQLAVTTILSKKVPLPSDKGFAQEFKDDGVISIIADVPEPNLKPAKQLMKDAAAFQKNTDWQTNKKVSAAFGLKMSAVDSHNIAINMKNYIQNIEYWYGWLQDHIKAHNARVVEIKKLYKKHPDAKHLL